jgi:sugar lactone lactonase YvrE
VLTGLTISNGIGWSPDASTMYLKNSGSRCLDSLSADGPDHEPPRTLRPGSDRSFS